MDREALEAWRPEDSPGQPAPGKSGLERQGIHLRMSGAAKLSFSVVLGLVLPCHCPNPPR